MNKPQKKFYTLVSILIFSFACHAQWEEGMIANAGHSGFFIPDSNQYYIPAYKHVSVYSKTDISAPIIYKTQSFSDSLRVIQTYPESYVRFRGIYGCWCKVYFRLNSKGYIGYIPSQLLGVVAIRQGNKKYLAFAESYSKGTIYIAMKIIENQQLVSEYRFESLSPDVYFPVAKDTTAAILSGYLSLELYSNKGLKDIDDIVKISTGVDACGYWNGTKVLLLKNNAVINTLEEGGIGDAGVFYHNIRYLFPSDSLGSEGHVIKIEEHYEVTEETDTLADVWTSHAKWKWENPRFMMLDSVYSSERVSVGH